MYQEDLDNYIEDYSLAEKFSPDEDKFVKAKEYPEQDRINFTWRYECLWVMLWALGYVKELAYPDTICDPGFAIETIIKKTPEEFTKQAKLRNASEILDEADLIYRYHWAVVDARVNSKPTPTNLDPGVVQERHYALNWLVGYMDQEWDEISTDT